MFVPVGPLTSPAPQWDGSHQQRVRELARSGRVRSPCVLFTETGAGRSVPRASVRQSPVLGPAPGWCSHVPLWMTPPGSAGTGPGAGDSGVGSQAPFPRDHVAEGPSGRAGGCRLCSPGCGGAVNPRETVLPLNRCSRACPWLRPPGVKGHSSLSSPTHLPCLCRPRM